MEKKKSSKIANFFKFRSIGSKLLASLVIAFVILLVVLLIILSRFSTSLVETLMLEKLKTDINYLEDIISGMEDSSWRVEDGSLYRGDVLIGDGTEENANLEPFYEAEEKTGTFVYAFMKVGDEGLEWSGDQKTGYQEGHFIRVAGSTKGPNGESIVGTYIDKQVADVLDATGEYEGAANVAGGQIYCYYRVIKNADGNVVGNIVAGRSVQAIRSAAQIAANSMVALLVILLMITAAGIFIVIRRWTKSVEKVEKYIQRIGKGELPEDRLEIKTRGEISDVADSVNDMVESLKEKKRISAELDVASDIQANLLPKIFPPFPGRDEFDLYASMDPAKEVGGDFYDFFMIDMDHLALVIADVSGKGVPAALFMVTAKTLIKDYGMLGLDAGEVFTRANNLMCESNDTGLFVTGWMAIIELSTGKATYVNAGHNPPLLCHDGKFRYLKSKAGFVLAGMDGMRYKSEEFQIVPGDILYLYTDGVTESTNEKNELFGEDRLLEYVNAHKDESMKGLCEGVRAAALDFTGEAPQYDDITMVAFKYLGGRTDVKELTLDAVKENIPVITGFIDGALEELGCEMKPQMQIDVAVDEIASNVASYAYKGLVGFIKIIVKPIDNAKVAIKFIDGGMPYNPLSNETPDLTASAEEREIGGLGIHIVRQTMDSVEYSYDNGRNILTITKTIKTVKGE